MRVVETLGEMFERNCVPEPNSGCVLWLGSVLTRRGGYGNMVYRGVNTRAHRYSWARTKGPIPAGLSVLHKCDVRLCANPEHLFLGTQADNMEDRRRKGRAPQGKGHWNYQHGGYVGKWAQRNRARFVQE